MDLRYFKREFTKKLDSMSDEELVESFRDIGMDVDISLCDGTLNTVNMINKLVTKEDIPDSWKRLTVRKKTTVKIRESNGVEKFKVSWSDDELVSDPDVDLILIANDGGEYPCKIDIFNETYEMRDNTAMDRTNWEYVKKGTNTLVEIPEDIEPFEIETLEGVVGDVAYPDFVVIGAKGELYVNTREFYNDNLEVVD